MDHYIQIIKYCNTIQLASLHSANIHYAQGVNYLLVLILILILDAIRDME